MQIKFNQIMYELVQAPYAYQTRFSCTIEKGDNTYDSIIEDTEAPEEITVYDDEGEITGVYSGYTHRIAISIIDNISIELENVNILSQLDNIASSVANLEEEQETQAAQIAELEESQETQDGAIEDLAEVVNSIIE